MTTHHPYGLLDQLLISSKPWQSISLHFITDLNPDSQGFGAILTVVDQYTKMVHFVPYTKEITNEETARIVMREVFWHYGLPERVSSMIMDLNLSLNFGSISSKCSRSPAISPPAIIPKQMNNQTLEQYLRCFLSYQ